MSTLRPGEVGRLAEENSITDTESLVTFTDEGSVVRVPRSAVVAGVGGGATDLLGTFTPSAGTIDVVSTLDNVTYDRYVFTFAGLGHDDGSPQSLQMLVSTNNGSSYETGAIYYFGANGEAFNGTNAEFASSAATAMSFTQALTNVAKVSGSLTLIGAGTANRKAAESNHLDDNDVSLPFNVYYHGGGMVDISTAIDAVRFQASGGNITGSIKVYGVKAA